MRGSHAHYGDFGPNRICESAIPEEYKSTAYTQLHDVMWRNYSAGPATVCQRAKDANVKWSVVSPVGGLIPRGRWGEGGADAFKANEDCAKVVEAHDGLLQWVIVNPFQRETFEQAEAMLRTPKCVGIKLHPEEHCYRITEKGGELFDFAARNNALVMCHSGHRNSVPEDYIPFADAHPDMNVILAHLGNSGDIGDGDPTHHVRAINASAHGNVYTDTSSSASVSAGLVEYAIKHWCAQPLASDSSRCLAQSQSRWAASLTPMPSLCSSGADKILFGSDTPNYFTGMQRARIDYAECTEAHK